MGGQYLGAHLDPGRLHRALKVLLAAVRGVLGVEVRAHAATGPADRHRHSHEERAGARIVDLGPRHTPEQGRLCQSCQPSVYA